ncbi:MAG: hypothetical protein OXJ54_03275 [Gemmatimonadetes bacterium]|nr:hypothetical protein [Candidatus Palauibacter rhopaloidicola]
MGIDMRLRRPLTSRPNRFRIPAVLSVALVFLSLGCGLGSTAPRPRSNRAPEIAAEIPQIILRGWTPEYALAVSPYFSDPDGDSLTFSATSESTVRPGAPDSLRVSGNFLELSQGMMRPASEVVVTATDAEGRTAQQTFGVVVTSLRPGPPTPYRPVSTAAIPPTTLRPGETTRMALGDFFDVRPRTTYGVTSSSGSTVRAQVSGDTLILEGRRPGPARIRVVATHEAGYFAEQTFNAAVVPPEAPSNAWPFLPKPVRARLVPVRSRVSFDVSTLFQDPDEDVLFFSAASAEPEKVAVSLSGARLTLLAKDGILWVLDGGSRITVTATDAGGLFAVGEFEVVLLPALDAR